MTTSAAIPDATEGSLPNSATNACKLCTPLGACLAFRGVAGAIPFLHGGQGCATYIRRYLISHFREPMDIAASNFSEASAVFGGGANLRAGLANVLRQYEPSMVGVATTCLSETIGEDVPGHLHEFAESQAQPATPIVPVSTPSYNGTHVDGFHSAVRAMVESLAATGPVVEVSDGACSYPSPVAVFPGMVSPADLRELKRLASEVRIPMTLLPDYSETLDGPSWADYEKLPAGGTPIEAIRALGSASASIEFGRVLAGAARTAGKSLESKHHVPLQRIGIPIGLRETDRFLEVLAALTGRPLPKALEAERGRLVDSWVDGHKYVFAKRAVVYGEEDFVVGMASFLCEIGIVPVLCASGGHSGRFETALRAAVPELGDTMVHEGSDFADIAAEAGVLEPDLLIGSSKGYGLAQQLGIPLVRCGFPIHDRIGGQRILHLGYAGAQALFVNCLLDRKQALSPIGYSYL